MELIRSTEASVTENRKNKISRNDDLIEHGSSFFLTYSLSIFIFILYKKNQEYNPWNLNEYI